MSEPQRPTPRIPQVNLFVPPPRGLALPVPDRFMELVLVALIVLVWAAVGVGIALLFGWHPTVGVSL